MPRRNLEAELVEEWIPELRPGRRPLAKDADTAEPDMIGFTRGKAVSVGRYPNDEAAIPEGKAFMNPWPR